MEFYNDLEEDIITPPSEDDNKPPLSLNDKHIESSQSVNDKAVSLSTTDKHIESSQSVNDNSVSLSFNY